MLKDPIASKNTERNPIWCSFGAISVVLQGKHWFLHFATPCPSWPQPQGNCGCYGFRISHIFQSTKLHFWPWGYFWPRLVLALRQLCSRNLQSPVTPLPELWPPGMNTNRSCGVDISIPYNIHLSTPYNINLVRQNLHRVHCILTPSPVYRNPRYAE